jgi:hypothetical protein
MPENCSNLYAVHSWFCHDPLVTGGATGLLLKVQDTITRLKKKNLVM